MSGVSGTMDETLPRMRLGIGISSTGFPHDRKSLPDMREMDGPPSVSPLAMLPPTNPDPTGFALPRRTVRRDHDPAAESRLRHRHAAPSLDPRSIDREDAGACHRNLGDVVKCRGMVTGKAAALQARLSVRVNSTPWRRQAALHVVAGVVVRVLIELQRRDRAADRE